MADPAEQTPLTVLEPRHALKDAGAPEGLVNLMSSPRAAMVAEDLLGGSRVRKLSFTGSRAVARKPIPRSADRVARLSLELGEGRATQPPHRRRRPIRSGQRAYAQPWKATGTLVALTCGARPLAPRPVT
jgi:hypothetical protein